ncbi:hypothetical protein HDE_09328 [Halotydeus destructor]|nr:hypothetical protein HDE_09328 [Halotydeus destructor]
MRIIVSISAILIGLNCARGSVINESPECVLQLNQTEGCLRRMITSVVDQNLPRTGDDLQKGVCRQYASEAKCLRSYGNKCLRLLPKTLFGIAVKQVDKQFKRFCFTPEGQKELLENIQCLQNDYVDIINFYMNLITNYLDHIADNVALDEIFPHVCCVYFTLTEKVRVTIVQHCKNDAGNSTADFLVGLANAVSGDLVEMACGKRYATAQQCEQNLPQSADAYRRVEDRVKMLDKKDFSIIAPIIKVIRRLDRDL